MFFFGGGTERPTPKGNESSGKARPLGAELERIACDRHKFIGCDEWWPFKGQGIIYMTEPPAYTGPECRGLVAASRL